MSFDHGRPPRGWRPLAFAGGVRYFTPMPRDTSASDGSSGTVPRRMRRTAFTFIAGFALLITLGLGAWIASYSTRTAFTWVNHTQLVLRHARELLRLVMDAEGGERGYLITGDDSFLEPFAEAERRARAEIATLRDMVGNNPRQLAAIAAMEPEVETILGQLRERIAARREEGFDVARAAVLTERAELNIDQLAARIDRFVDTENTLLAQREQDFVQRSHLTTIVISVALILTVALLGFEVRVLHRRTRELEAVVTMCAWTKRVKHRGEWVTVEQYLLDRFGLHLTHGISDEGKRHLELEELEHREPVRKD